MLFVLLVATFLEASPPSASDYSRLQLLLYGVMPLPVFLHEAEHPVVYLSAVWPLNGTAEVLVPKSDASGLRDAQILKVSAHCTIYTPGLNETQACPYPGDTNSEVW